MVLGQSIVIAPTTRNEGHGKFVLDVDEDGIVKKGSFLSMVTVRGFEKFLVGRGMEFAPVATSRFCGLCPPTHATASSGAVESSIGLSPPRHGLLLRELCNIGNHLHDHPLQQVLVLPDFVKEPEKYREALARIQKMRRIGQYICSVVGGEAIHSPHIRVGGMYTNISEAARHKLAGMLEEYTQYHEAQSRFMEDAFSAAGVPPGLGVNDVDMMATDLIYGRSDVFEEEYFPYYSELLPANYYGKDIGVEACTRIPLLRGKIVEVGPVARLWKYKGWREKGTMALNRARLTEISLRIERGLEILRELNTRAHTLNRPVSYGIGRMGIGVNEAPRGTNVHITRVEDGRITYYKAMPATMWNISTIGKSTEGFHYKWAQWVMRSYDPCISCATHMIVVHEGRVVEERYI